MDFEPIVRFAVMSDIHYQENSQFQRERFKKAMETIYAYSETEKYKALDALYIVGDFADTGHTEQIEMMGEDCKKYVKAETKLVVTLANHELHYIPDASVSMADFKRVFNMDFDRHEVINGYHFISLSSTIDKGPWHDSFDAPKREFLKTELEKAAKYSDKPIFVFQHPGQTGTVAGGYYGNTELYEILADYPQVIDFSGHSHCPVNWPKEIHQRDFTSVSTGSLYDITNAKLCPEFDGQLFDSSKTAHMLVAEGDAAGRVRILLLDVVAGAFFENEYFIEDAFNKAEYKYTEKRAKTSAIPYFDSSAEGKLIIEDKTVKACFSRAKCDGERIFGYRICLKKGETVIEQKNVISDFVNLIENDEYCVTFENIKETDVAAQIYAIGFWNNLSKPLEIKCE